jgi:hypothetical protein
MNSDLRHACSNDRSSEVRAQAHDKAEKSPSRTTTMRSQQLNAFIDFYIADLLRRVCCASGVATSAGTACCAHTGMLFMLSAEQRL